CHTRKSTLHPTNPRSGSSSVTRKNPSSSTSNPSTQQRKKAMPAHTTHAKKICRKIGDNFPKISRVPISPVHEKNLSQNRGQFPKNLSHAHLIRSQNILSRNRRHFAKNLSRANLIR